MITHGCMATFTSCVNNNMCCIRLAVNHSEISNSKYSCLMTLEINFEIIIQLFLKLLDDISSSVFSAPQQNIYWISSVYSRYFQKTVSDVTVAKKIEFPTISFIDSYVYPDPGLAYNNIYIICLINFMRKIHLHKSYIKYLKTYMSQLRQNKSKWWKVI